MTAHFIGMVQNVLITGNRCVTSGPETPLHPEHPSSSSVFSEVRVTRSLVLCVCIMVGW